MKPTPDQARRLREAVEEAAEAGKSQERLARAAGYAGQSALGMALSRGSRPKQLPELLAELGVTENWYKTGSDPKYTSDLDIPVRPESVTFPTERVVELVEWRDLSMKSRPVGVFAVEAPDDAMAPVIRRGMRVEVDTKLVAAEEDIVLLADSEDKWYLRNYIPLPKKRWEAHREGERPVPMDSERDGLQVIAVVTRIHRRRP